jgi:hypothetical protein
MNAAEIAAFFILQATKITLTAFILIHGVATIVKRM